MKAWLKNAFAVDSGAPVEPNEAQRRVIDRVCAAVVSRRLTTPAQLYLETARPLGYIGSQVMYFFQPIVATILDTSAYEEFARFLESRGAVDYLSQRLDAIEALHRQRSTGTPAGRAAPAGDHNPQT